MTIPKRVEIVEVSPRDGLKMSPPFLQSKRRRRSSRRCRAPD